MSNNPLIAFRATVDPKQKYIAGGPIEFPDGCKGVICNIMRVSMERDGRVYVIGKYRETSREEPAR
jgi:hypothetical protein